MALLKQTSEFWAARMKNKNNVKWIWVTVGIILLAIILFATFIDIEALLRIFKRIHWDFYLLGVVFLVMGIILITVRWRLLLRNEPDFVPSFHANSVSYMLKLLLPVPQALIRLTAFSIASSTSVYQAAPMMLIERFLEMIMRLVAFILAITVFFDIPLWIAVLVIAALLLFAVPAFVLWFSRNASTVVPRLVTSSARIPELSKEKLRDAMVDFKENVTTMRAAKGITIAALYSLAMWGLFLLFYAFGFQALGIRLDTREILAMSAMVLAVLPPSTPAMIGVYQGVIVAILLPFGILDVNTATAYALLVFGAQLVVWVIFGIWGLKRTGIRVSSLSGGSLS